MRIVLSLCFLCLKGRTADNGVVDVDGVVGYLKIEYSK
jgi:hypothetical protein